MPEVSRRLQHYLCSMCLDALERFTSWRPGLQESQPGFSPVSRLIMAGDPVLSNTTALSLCTQMSLPLTPLSRVMES